MSLLRNPVAQFLAFGLVVLGVLVATTGWLSGRAARDEAIVDARGTTAILAHSIAEPAMPRGLVDGDPGAIDRFDRAVLDRLLVGDVRRIKIWDASGTIVYSDETELIGRRYELDEDEVEILRNGGTFADVTSLDKPENRFEQAGGASNEWLLEVYTHIESPEGDPLLFEAYYAAGQIETRRQDILRPFRSITLGALAVMLAVATPLLWGLTRLVTRAADERERLLRQAVDSSAAERRRIARDLHDGVVQDLAGTAYSLSAMAASAPDPTQRERLSVAGDALRSSLRSLRSLLVEIHPPDLCARTIGSALEDLLAPADNAGIRTALEVDDLEGVDQGTIAMIWRVAQEAVRNATRHAAPRSLTVTVTRDDGQVRLDVVDDGRGFDAGQPPGLGLRGLMSQATDNGGTLTLTSGPGRGTRVRLTAPVGDAGGGR